MSHSALEYLRHILEEANYLMAQAQGLNQAQFARDDTLKRAFVRSLEIIGEATKRVPTELRGCLKTCQTSQTTHHEMDHGVTRVGDILVIL